MSSRSDFFLHAEEHRLAHVVSRKQGCGLSKEETYSNTTGCEAGGVVVQAIGDCVTADGSMISRLPVDRHPLVSFSLCCCHSPGLNCDVQTAIEA